MTRVFAHSRWDAAMVAVALAEIGLTSLGSVSWGRLSLPASALLAGFCIILNCMNYQCIAHSFIHHPFFSSGRLNRVFSVVSSLALLAPQSLYRIHHLDLETGRTRDGSSTYRYSKQPGREESVFAYALWGPLRVDYPYLYRRCRKYGAIALLWVEATALLAYCILLAALNWRGLICFLLPVLYLGQACALAHNYAEHHGAQPGNRRADSVSCYGYLYNKLWFNEGYHQEHHFRPQVHWTQLPALRALMLPETQRRVVAHIHWVNLLGERPRRSAR
jgi:fatty acid desaturase